MNVLLVSQCDKRALTETRRILDQFAERRGDRTWQTAITQAGLDTLRKLLRKTARKNTAVACHWIRGLDHSELVWIVGDASRFNADGAVPTNMTKRDILRQGDENDWHTEQDIRLLATLAALLHDLGKASVAFQERLAGKRTEKNLYRHEWVSLRLFLAFVGGDDDTAWLTRMAGDATVDMSVWTAADRYSRDGVDRDINRHPFHELTSRAPLAAAIGWLIVTHHRLPVIPVTDEKTGRQAWLGKRAERFEQAWLETPLDNVAHDWNEVDPQASSEQAKPYWDLAGPLPAIAPAWRAQAARAAKALLTLLQQRNGDWLGNPYVMHLARLTLMLADHHYSSLGVGPDNRAVAERRRFVQTGQTVFANTLRAGVMKQSLLEHLLGVGHTASLVAHALPNFERHLPRLVKHRGLRKRSADSRFTWQDKAFDAAVGLREAARERGAFIVDMASTGCGKTLANARILYALADPQLGLRASYALGLRTLTLQTGRSYRHDLHLQDDELAVLVGGSASRALFAYYQARAEASGSASSQALIEEDSHVLYEGNVADHPLLSRALANPDIRRLLSAPMLVCTIDHLAPATESLRAGRQIAPMLRLMSSDLVLDELDDYGLDDLPALTRLMHWAGLLGTRVALSSATLAPALVEGMFLAYHAGRTHYQRNRGRVDERRGVPIEVPCLWADEFGTQTQTCFNADGFAAAHRQFVARRVAKLQAAAPLRRAELVPTTRNAMARERIRAEFAHAVRDACLRLHHDHATTDPATGKRTSFGLIRMANIDPIFDVAQALYTLGSPADTRIHLCVYHARFPLLQRSAIEAMLDATFNRRDEAAVWQQPQVRHALDTCSEPNQLFVVLASPVCEVGRDWDADWAVVEPSSMRSLIQLAGRVQRHRRIPGVAPNMLLFDTNLSGLEQGGTRDPVFTRPGFEKSTLDGRFLLSSHSLQILLAEHEYRHVDAVPRIQSGPMDELQPRERWVDLEQARIHASMLPVVPTPSQSSSRRRANPTSRLERDQAAPAWQFPQAALTGVLPQQQPFREQTLRETTLAWLPNEDEDKLEPHRVEDDPVQRGQKLYVPAPEMFHCIPLQPTNRIDRWGQFDLLTLLTEQAEDQGRELANIARVYSVVQAPRSSQGWRWHPWLGVTRQR